MFPLSDSRTRLVLATALAMAAAMGIGRFVYTPILPSMMTELGLSVAATGWIASSNYVGYLVGALWAGAGWKQGRDRLVIISALLASTIFLAAMAASGALVWLLIVRFLGGVASAFVLIFATNAVIAELAGTGREHLLSWHFGGVGAGIALSAIVTATTGAAGTGWQSSWLVSALISLLCLGAVVAFYDKSSSTTPGMAREPRLRPAASYWLLLAGYGLFGFGYIVTATFLVAIIRQGAGSAGFEALVWLATGLAGIPSVWLWGQLAARWGQRQVFAVGCLTEAVGVFASTSLGGMAGPLLGGVLLGGTFIAITALGIQAARKLSGDAPRKGVALMTASFGTGQVLGPIAAAELAERTGDFHAASLMAGVALLLAAFFAMASHRAG